MVYNLGMTLNINIETKNVIKIFTLATGFTLGVFAVAKMYDAIILITIAFFVALALNPAVHFLSKYMPRKKRGPAIAIVMVGLIATLGFLLASIVPPVVKETGNFIDSFPLKTDGIFYNNETVQTFIKKYKLQDNIDLAVEGGKRRILNIGEDAVRGVGYVGSSFISTTTILVVAVLMLTGGPKLLNSSADLLYRDQRVRNRHKNLAKKMYGAVTGDVVGQVSLAIIAASFALGALALLGVPYPLPLAAIVFVFGLVPLVGNTLAAILVVISTFILKDATAGIILLLFFIVYQQIENMTLQPIVQGKTTDLSPLIVFVSVILGVALIGPIGGLLAIPAAACGKVFLLDYFEHRDDIILEDSPKTMIEKVKNQVIKATK